jgi:hypothetical protein
MRRWVCIVALLAGFTSDDYGRHARLPRPIPIERLLGATIAGDRGPDRPTGGQTIDWWTAGSRRSLT